MLSLRTLSLIEQSRRLRVIGGGVI
jgi:hypothetical protein